MEYFVAEESCLNATYDQTELKLIDGYRKLSSWDQQEILELIQFKLNRSPSIKRAPKEMVISSTSTTLEESETIENMA